MSKQDRQGVRTPSDIERKYDLGNLADENKRESEKVSQIAQAFSQYAASTSEKIAELEEKVTNSESEEELNAHVGDKDNPHEVTKEQVGLGNVDNTSDANKPVSTATQDAIDAAYYNANLYADQKVADLIGGAPSTLDTLKEIADAMAENETIVEALEDAIGSKANEAEFNSHATNKNNPHGVTKTQVGLGNVDNTSDANKPISAATQAALDELSADITEAKKSCSDGKSALASAITAQGVPTLADATFATMATNVGTVATNKYNAGNAAGVAATKKGNATTAQVLKGKTFTNASGVNLTGAMNDYSSNVQTVTLTAVQAGTVEIDIPDGYHTKIKVNSSAVYSAGHSTGYQQGLSGGGGTGGNTLVDTIYNNGTLKSGISLTNFSNSGGTLNFNIAQGAGAVGSVVGIDNSKACLVKVEGTYSMLGSNNMAIFKTGGKSHGCIGYYDWFDYVTNGKTAGSFEFIMPIASTIEVLQRAGLAGYVKISKITTYY